MSEPDKEKLRELLHEYSAEAEKTMLEEKEVMINFILILPGGQRLKLDHKMLDRIGCNMEYGAHKDQLGELIRELAAYFECTHYVHYCESWVSHTTEKDDIKRLERGEGPRVMPRDDPNRFEVVHFVVENKTHSLFATRGIVRPAGQDPWLHDDLEWNIAPLDEGYRGRFAGVLRYELPPEKRAEMDQKFHGFLMLLELQDILRKR